MTFTCKNILIEDNLTYGTNSPYLSTTPTTSNGTLTLTVTSTFVQVFTGTATGFSIVLPDATTLTTGWKFEFNNRSSATITIKYSDGTIFANMLPTSYVAVMLESAQTANGVWIRWSGYTGGTSSGILHYDISSATPFTISTGTADTLITGMSILPAQGEYAVWYQGGIQITGNNTVVRTTLYTSGVLVTESLRSIKSSVSTFFTTHMTSGIITFNGTTDTLEVRVARNSNTLTINSRSVIMIRLGDGT